MKLLGISCLSILVICLLNACSSDKKSEKWQEKELTVEKWENFELQGSKGKAAFPKRPVSKTIAYSADINILENYVISDSVTYSVTLIENKALKTPEAWKNFLEKEVLAFKAIERRKIKLSGRDAVLSKVRENDLCGYSINFIVDNRYVANLVIRYKGEFPTEKLLMTFAERVKLK
jgi:hypothetical protein